MIKVCIGCEQSFETEYSWQKACSKACMKRVKYRSKHGLPITGKIETRNKTARPQRTCEFCGEIYTPYRKRSRFCTELCGAKWHYEQKNNVIRIRTCKECEKQYNYKRGDRLWYCSDECAKIAATRSRIEGARKIKQWHKDHPEKITEYREAAKQRNPQAYRNQQSKNKRFFKRYPHILPICQACGEKRVVELAHKIPRNGMWASPTNTTDKDVWILCPTCHRVLDYGIQTREELGLPE